MKTDISVPFAAFLATVVAVGRLLLVPPAILVVDVGSPATSGIGAGRAGNIVEYLLLGRGILHADVAMQQLFVLVVLWVVVFSTVWFLGALVARGPAGGR